MLFTTSFLSGYCSVMEEVGEKKNPLVKISEVGDITDTTVGQTRSGCDPMKRLDDPPVDWYEPLEEDWEDESVQSWDIDEVKYPESLAGEGERSGSVAGSERKYSGRGGCGAIRRRRRKLQLDSDDGWEDCPALGEGWKRKVVLRRSGVSVGQRDIYYLSPECQRVRSKIELLKYVRNTVDLTNFDYRTGIFLEGDPPKRAIKKRKMDPSSPADCGVSSESSFHNDAAEGYDGTHSPGSTNNPNYIAQQRFSPSFRQKDLSCVPSPGSSNENSDQALVIQPATSTRQSVALKVPANLEDGPTNNLSTSSLGICLRCRNSFTSIKEQTICEKCSIAHNASKDNRNITFRKWLPCGFCRACQLTEDCGVCASCRNGKLNPQHQKPVRCRKRKCLCPSVKRKADDVLPLTQCDSVVHRTEKITMVSKPSLPDFKESQNEHLSDSDDQSSFYEESNSEELLRTFHCSCGLCKGCVAKEDCGVCDYCIDKPKFGGCNKKRQRCRQRLCQQEAKAWTAPGRPGPHYAYSLKVMRKNREKWDFDFSDNECEKITEIFSLGGDNAASDGIDLELLELLASLRDAPLPMLWCAVLAEGPHLQLLQCSKLSAMADTIVQIEPSFRYHISVQGQPLLPTHRLYNAHPAQLTSVVQVVTLLEDLERYSVCQGFKSEPPLGAEPVVQVRAATCEFLVVPENQCCIRCKSAQEKQ